MDDEDSIELDATICEIEYESKDRKEKGTLGKKFIDLLGQGYKPGEAARFLKVEGGLKGIVSDTKIQKEIKGLLDSYTLSADIRRAITRAGINKVALDNLNNPDPSAQKLALDALKAIGSDTEVGINAPPQPGIQINVGNLSGIFESLEEKKELDFVDVEVINEDKTNKGNVVSISQVLDAKGIEELKKSIEEEEEN